jgi:hypothetical protein
MFLAEYLSLNCVSTKFSTISFYIYIDVADKVSLILGKKLSA